MGGFTGFQFLCIRSWSSSPEFKFQLNRRKFFPFQPPRKAGLLDILEADAKWVANMARETFEKEGPLLVIASGRDTISVSSSRKRLAPENIQHPRSQLNRFDLVITPRHDYYPLTPDGRKQIPSFLRRWITPREPPGRNVILTVGALHQANCVALRSAASAWHDELATVDFQKSLQERGVARPFTGEEDMSKSWSYPPLNDTTEATLRVNSALAERGWSILT